MQDTATSRDDAWKVDNLAMLVARLARRLPEDDDQRKEAFDSLDRIGWKLNPLRSESDVVANKKESIICEKWIIIDKSGRPCTTGTNSEQRAWQSLVTSHYPEDRASVIDLHKQDGYRAVKVKWVEIQ